MSRIAAAIVALALVIAACGGAAPAGTGGAASPGASGGQSGSAIRVQLPGALGARFAGYQAALDQGFYREAGLDIQLVPSASEADAVKAVADGAAQFGVAPMMRVMAAQEAGARLVMVGQIMQRSGVSIVSLKASKITDARSMRGKKVGVRADGTEVEVLQAIEKAGLDPAKDVTLTAVTDLGGFLAGELDAVQVVSYEDLVALLETPNASGARWTLADLFVFNFNDVVVATSMIPDGIVAGADFLAAAGNDDVTVRFLVASARGWAHCRDNQDACVEVVRTAGAAGGVSHEAFILNETLALIWPAFTGIGEIDRSLWSLTARVAQAGGLLTREPAEGAFRTDLAKKAADQLDSMGVDKRARSFEKSEVTVNEGGA